MNFFELEATDISSLNDGDLRELVGRLCEAELIQQGAKPSCVTWGGAQEAADGGLDVHVRDVDSRLELNFVCRENTGFQVKKHSMRKADCRKEMQDKGRLKTVIADLASRGGAYIIVSGKDDCTDKMLADRLDGMKEAVTALPTKGQLHLDFYGRDRLSAWLRRHPSVALWARSRLGKPIAGWRPFERWAATPPDQEDDFLADDHPCITDANSISKEPQPVSIGLQLTRDRLRRLGSIVRITGLSGVGKTRFAQALFEPAVGIDALPQSEVIYADLGNLLTPTASELVTYLIAHDFANYLVLDNCPPDVHRNLQKQAAVSRAKLRLLTIEYDISEDKPEETDVIHLEPISEANVSRLLQKRYPALGQVNADKVAEFAGGNARIGLALASRVDADETLTNFSDEALFERLFSQRKGNSPEFLQRAEVLALVYSFNVSRKEYGDELNSLGAIAGVSRKNLHSTHAELQRRHLVQERGSWRAVLPHALANRLVRRALENISSEDINVELFKRENIRLLQSCAHRLGYLHDFAPARDLALSWIQPDAPLADIARCDDQHLVVLKHVAPVFPEAVLRSIEEASRDPEFASRKNERFSRFVRLLCHLAYEDRTFDRAIAVLLKFAETEKSGENNNSIVWQLQQLFSIRFSGTEATPQRRQAFVRQLISSGKTRHKEIAADLLQTAFGWRGGLSINTFQFGAHKRGTGWNPQTAEDVNAWFDGFTQLLIPPLESGKEDDRSWAMSVVAKNFRRLWSYSKCFDQLERIVRDYGRGGQFPEIWLAIKSTLHFDSSRIRPEALSSLKSLEKIARPKNLIAKIRNYVLVDPWNHVDLRSGDYQKNMDNMREKVITLGKMASTDLSTLVAIGAEIWEGRSTSLFWFGEGIARGADEKIALFELLVDALRQSEPKNIHPIVLKGFLSEIHNTSAVLAREIQERAIQLPDLKAHSVYILAAIPLAPWGAAKLLQLAQSGELDASRFKTLGFGRVDEAIPDSEFATLISSINSLNRGYLSTIELLSMRFFEADQRKYLPNSEILAAARGTLRAFLLAHHTESGQASTHALDLIASRCIGDAAPKDEVKHIIELLCEGVETYRLYGHEINHLSSALIRMHTESFLDTVFDSGKDRSALELSLFKERSGLDETSINDAPLERVLAWCKDNEQRIQRIAAATHAYVNSGGKIPNQEDPENLVLSEHIKSLLDVSTDKLAVVEVIFENIYPSSWSGSRAGIIELRSKAFAQLLDHPDARVQALVRTKLSFVEEVIRRELESEAAEHSRREQRFE